MTETLRAYTFLGTSDEVNACDCCGRTDLKSTVALEDEHGHTVFFGVVCAARALKIPATEVKARTKAADDAKAAAARAAREAVQAVRAAEWRAFLISEAGEIRDFRGDLDIFAMIQKLGGYAAARALQESRRG